MSRLKWIATASLLLSTMLAGCKPAPSPVKASGPSANAATLPASAPATQPSTRPAAAEAPQTELDLFLAELRKGNRDAQRQAIQQLLTEQKVNPDARLELLHSRPQIDVTGLLLDAEEKWKKDRDRDAAAEIVSGVELILGQPGLTDEILARSARLLRNVQGKLAGDSRLANSAVYLSRYIAARDAKDLPLTISEVVQLRKLMEVALLADIPTASPLGRQRIVSVVSKMRGGDKAAFTQSLDAVRNASMTGPTPLQELELAEQIARRNPEVLDEPSIQSLREMAIPATSNQPFHERALNILTNSDRLERPDLNRLVALHEVRYASILNRRLAIKELVNYAAEPGVAAVMGKVLRDTTDAELFYSAASVLTAGGEKAAVAAPDIAEVVMSVNTPELTLVMDRTWEQRRIAAMKALAATGQAGVAQLVKNGDEVFANGWLPNMLRAAAQVGGAAAPILVGVLDIQKRSESRREIITELARPTMFGPVAEAKLVDVIGGKNAEAEKLLAITAMRWSDGKNPAVHKALQAALASDHGEMRTAAADAIVRLPPPDAQQAVEAVLPWLSSDDARQRVSAAMLIREAPGKVAAEKVLPELLAMTTNQKPQVRIAAAYAIAAMEPKGDIAAKAARNFAATADLVALRLILPGLRERKDDDLRGDLRVMSIEDANPEVREAARMAVKEIGLPGQGQ